MKKLINKFKNIIYRTSSERFCKFLRSKGISIGEGTHIEAKTAEIDLTRPSLVTIGRDCYINHHFTLLTHDWVTHVFIHSDREFLPSSGRVTIGNNVGFGQNVMVLKGVTIGDNSFIGANSVVTKNIPANSVAVGSPCKVICTLEEYYQKRMEKSVEEALYYAKSIQERFDRRPVIEDFWEEFPLFVSGNDVDKYPTLPLKKQLGPMFQSYVSTHKAKYSSFDEFLQAAGIE